MNFLFLSVLLFTSINVKANGIDFCRQSHEDLSYIKITYQNISRAGQVFKTVKEHPIHSYVDCSYEYCDQLEINSFKARFFPIHPKADHLGYVKMYDVDLIEEMSRLIEHTKNYEQTASLCKQVTTHQN